MRSCLRSGLVLLLSLLGGASVSSQPAPAPCEDVLAEAEQRYLEQDFDSVEPYVIECVYRPGVTERQLQDAYRLLALAYIRQDLLADAQLTIVKLFGVDYEYEPDPVSDPPFYVALVTAVKDQLRVEVENAEAAGALQAASEVDAAPEAVPEPPPASAPVAREPVAREPVAREPVAREPVPDDPAPEVSGDGVAYEPVVVTPIEGTSGTAPRGVVDINTASSEELESLSGIGPALAARILDYRADYGPFARPEDLQNVRGIGARTLESLRPFITTGTGGPANATRAPALPAASGQIDLNTATAAELDALPGVGPALAQRIVDSRAQEGPFRSVDDVTRVRGIGPAKLEGFRDQVTVGD
ncbi:MAG: helix-hairpin-helix domain-containing protein [Bacteroidota bacterium]